MCVREGNDAKQYERQKQDEERVGDKKIRRSRPREYEQPQREARNESKQKAYVSIQDVFTRRVHFASICYSLLTVHAQPSPLI